MYKTYDQATVDSLGVFLIGQLEAFDRTVHAPLQQFRWTRDINIRNDASMGHDFTSYTNMAMASTGGINPLQKAFIGKDSTTLPNVALDVGKTTSPLIPWGLTLDFTIFELESSQLAGQGIDEQKGVALKRKWQQDNDIQVYLGDTTIPNCYGLLNSPQVTTTGNVQAAGNSSPTGNTGSLKWIDKTPDIILQDVNTLIYNTWAASGFEICPEKLMLPPNELQYIIGNKVSTAGNVSIYQFLKDNCISLSENGKPIDIVSVKWLTGTNNGNSLGPAAADSMCVYSQRYDLVRYPQVPLIGLPNQYIGVAQKRPYVGKLGVVEFVYPETVGYAQGIG